MRIREIIFNDFRCFRGEQRISFVDPVTDAARPVTVIAGTNGTGKTTILEVIEAMLKLIVDPKNENSLIREVERTGLIRLVLELPESELREYGRLGIYSAQGISEEIHIIAGRNDLVPSDYETERADVTSRLAAPPNDNDTRVNSGEGSWRTSQLSGVIRDAVLRMQQGEAELHGGFLYFPCDRQLKVLKGGVVEPPPPERNWLFRYSTQDQWKGSLEQLWVWQNYLDLGRDASHRASLSPFVSSVEEILGSDRRIAISEGRVKVPVPWEKENGKSVTVRIDQLPSGEQQCLLLFGELARRRRNGAIIAIDEPEISLHPTLQRLVIHQLQRWAREWDSQIILATHSLEILRSVHESERLILDHLEDTATHTEEDHATISHH